MTTKRGYSITELLVYIAILTFLLLIISNILISISKTQKVLAASRRVEVSGISIAERVSREIRAASSINIVTSVLGTHPGRLVLDGDDELGNTRTVEFYESNGKVYIMENGVDLGPLSVEGANVTSLVFRRFTGINSEGVRLELSIESGESASYKNMNFYSTAVIREAI
jgi:type II secretory pathway pseudopilin PulG